MAARSQGRGARDLRPIQIQRDFTDAHGSVLYTCGRTRVLCTATIEDGVPDFLKGKGSGWLTGHYEMLPASTSRRNAPRRVPDGRSLEIRRLIGRCLRAALALDQLGPRTIYIDCHVLGAHGGTRTACINAGYIALLDALDGELLGPGLLSASPLRRSVQAISVGLVGGQAFLDLDYPEDASAEVDFNVVAADARDLVEVQGTAEGGEPYSRDQLNALLDLAMEGLATIKACQEASRESAP